MNREDAKNQKHFSVFLDDNLEVTENRTALTGFSIKKLEKHIDNIYDYFESILKEKDNEIEKLKGA